MSDFVRKFVAVSIPFIGNIPSTMITKNEVKGWYKTLKKPSFTPPDYVFGPVWTMLYASMGFSSYLIWRDGNGFNERTLLPLSLYGSQLLLNWAWSLIFFGKHKLGLVIG